MEQVSCGTRCKGRSVNRYQCKERKKLPTWTCAFSERLARLMSGPAIAELCG